MINKVRYKYKYYGIIYIFSKKTIIPIILDWQDYLTIKSLNKKWVLNQHKSPYCIDTYNNVKKRVYLHDIIMVLICRENKQPYTKKRLYHINNIQADNRRANLTHKKHNTKKKLRQDNTIPSYVSYIGPNKYHGERYMIKIRNYTWKTTSSKKISKEDKLKAAKDHLNTLKLTKPELFNEFGILLADYNKIVRRLKLI